MAFCDWCSTEIDEWYRCPRCQSRFCTQRCYSAHWHDAHAPRVKCAWCGTMIQGRWRGCEECDGKYCSMRCWTAHVREVHGYYGDISSGDEGCFITTAVMRARGRTDDDCVELSVLRRFRDTYLSSTPRGRELVGAYYRTAPALVARIEASPARDAIYGRLYRAFVAECVRMVQDGDFDGALARYSEMVSWLSGGPELR